jgi:putative Holliday junction resolvase
MAKIIAIDFGIKRTGLAETDELQIIASGLETVATNQLMAFLERYVSNENVEAFVVGQAMRMSGEFSDVEVNILDFIKHLQKRFPAIAIHRQDERFTSKLALDAMIAGGVKKKDRRNKQKGIVDKVSAVLILQAFLENQSL